jgi:hypothetical protein
MADTAILCTNSAIYEEAYDTLVKTNRFVHVTSDIRIPLQLLVDLWHVPVVTGNKRRRRQLQRLCDRGPPSLAIDVKFPQDSNLMILHSDLGLLCEVLKDANIHKPGLTGRLQLSLYMARLLDCIEPGDSSPFDRFFSAEIQIALLAPTRATLREIKHANIQGHVQQNLALAAVNDISQDEWSDPQAVLADLVAAEEKGTTLFRQGKADEAYMAWSDAASVLDKIHASSSWPALAARGGEHFLAQIAETCLLVRLNVVQVQLDRMQSRHVDLITTCTAKITL